MRILLVEDEVLAQDKIRSIVQKRFPTFTIVDVAQSIVEFKEALDDPDSFDLILCDIHLADGLSFQALKGRKITQPIIFITAYDEYALDSFDHFCLDYILKPIEEERLVQAFEKHQKLQNFNSQSFTDSAVFEKILANYEPKSYKKRFLTKIGNRFKFISVDDVAFFFAQEGMTYLVEIGSAQKYIVDHNLNELMDELLDPLKFYRINRSVIVHLESLIEMKPFTNGRLSLTLNVTKMEEAIVVAREKVTDFKNWINQ